MKYVVKNIALLIFSLLFTYKSYSQEDDRKFKFGLATAGIVSWNNPDNKLMKNSGAGIGFSYGLQADYRFAKNYALSFGFDILKLNNNINFLNDTISRTYQSISGLDSSVVFPATSIYHYKFNYVNLPIALKLSTNEIGYLTYFVKFGFDLGIRTKANANIDYAITKPSGQPTILIEDYQMINQMALFRTGLLIGGGMEWNLSGNTNLMVGITYNNGFSNIFKKSFRDDNNFKQDNKTIAFDKNGDLKAGSYGDLKRSFSRYLALNVGVFF